MVAEDLGKRAFDEIAQPGNYNHVEAPARLEMVIDVLEEEVVVLIAGFGRQVGDCQSERLLANMFESVTELYRDVADVVQGGVFCCILDGNKILVDQQTLSLRRQPGDRQSQGAVTAAEVNRPVITSDIKILQQHARALIDGARGEESPGGVKQEMLSFERVAEVDLFAQLGNFILIQGQGLSLDRGIDMAGDLSRKQQDLRGNGGFTDSVASDRGVRHGNRGLSGYSVQ